MRKNQTIFSSVFFSCLLIVPLLLIIILQLWQTYLSHTAYNRMDKRQVTTIVAAKESVVWREEGREVTIDGEYFDIISWKLQEGKYNFTGVFDKEETAVHNLLGEQSASSNFIMNLLMVGQCFGAIVLIILIFSSLRLLKKRFIFFTVHYKFLYNRIITPPPRIWF